jgi:hypothetical protein
MRSLAVAFGTLVPAGDAMGRGFSTASLCRLSTGEAAACRTSVLVWRRQVASPVKFASSSASIHACNAGFVQVLYIVSVLGRR